MTIKNINLEHNNNDVHVIEFNNVKHQTVGDISKFFTKNKTDVLVITKQNKPYYVLTSTDIIDALVAHYDNIEISMYIDKNPKKVITINENETVFEAYRLMRSYKIHHLIVVNDNGDFSSVINFYDFASYLTEIALKDEMTGLYNKRFFEFILDRYKTEDIEIGIIFIDLDNFKKINDAFGHIFGDKVLKSVANIIKKSIRDIDYAFRFGGDEFVILIFSDYDVLKKVAKRIKEKILQTAIEGVKAECSIGYAHYPTDSNNLEEVLHLADKRMYEDKRRD
ncbi:sensory box histidine kinase [Nautilia profundicola AmH]|uniref:diguanylate cyclase n=1 Tax=Nautilia profundicola (strain ATCC BAA-1463 / DSM 18972 / AmH) TaxID=598659 RepID=B9LA54_NAUPA|nr:GGDEF domain-containing protein [Nautilia profundicola]ACM93444.1 sensory box histidine kinase [Nautilia profundicola AmH]